MKVGPFPLSVSFGSLLRLSAKESIVDFKIVCVLKHALECFQKIANRVEWHNHGKRFCRYAAWCGVVGGRHESRALFQHPSRAAHDTRAASINRRKMWPGLAASLPAATAYIITTTRSQSPRSSELRVVLLRDDDEKHTRNKLRRQQSVASLFTTSSRRNHHGDTSMIRSLECYWNSWLFSPSSNSTTVCRNCVV